MGEPKNTSNIKVLYANLFESQKIFFATSVDALVCEDDVQTGGCMEPVKRTYRLKDIMVWDDELYAATQDFKGRHGHYPNICCANEATLKLLDLAAVHHLIRDSKTTAGFTGLATFAWFEGEVKFAVEKELPNAEFQLVYDDKPEFIDDPDGGIELPKIRCYVLTGVRGKRRVPPRR